MFEVIRQSIADIEATHGVRVLYAAESGSRAWGFASPDSDYDVRFIYVPPRDWYLSVSERRDVIEAMLPGDLDLSGWELRKALGLYLRGNCALYEWLDSPIVYRESGPLAARLRELLPDVFRAPTAYHHYLRTAQSVVDTHLQGERVRIKKIFYVLRPLLACRWIRHTGTQPPMAFARLAEAAWITAAERAMIGELERAKARALESDAAPMSPEVHAWIVSELAAATQAAAALRSEASLSVDALDRLMVMCVAEAWG